MTCKLSRVAYKRCRIADGVIWQSCLDADKRPCLHWPQVITEIPKLSRMVSNFKIRIWKKISCGKLPNKQKRTISLPWNHRNIHHIHLAWEIARVLNPPACFLRLVTVSALEGGPLGGQHTLVQFHFHWGKSSESGSEHSVDGRVYAAEVNDRIYVLSLCARVNKPHHLLPSYWHNERLWIKWWCNSVEEQPVPVVH